MFFLDYSSLCFCCRTSGKIAIGVGAVYLTAEQGLWNNDSVQSSSNLERFKTKVLPATTDYLHQVRGIILGMGFANERPCNIVSSSLIGWAQTQNNPYR